MLSSTQKSCVANSREKQQSRRSRGCRVTSKSAGVRAERCAWPRRPLFLASAAVFGCCRVAATRGTVVVSRRRARNDDFGDTVAPRDSRMESMCALTGVGGRNVRRFWPAQVPMASRRQARRRCGFAIVRQMADGVWQMMRGGVFTGFFHEKPEIRAFRQAQNGHEAVCFVK